VQLAEEGGHLGMEARPAALSAGDDRGVVVADRLLRHPAHALEAA
jgi:hypothetical protein